MLIPAPFWDWTSVALDTMNLNREGDRTKWAEAEKQADRNRGRERNSGTRHLALCLLSIPPCHRSVNGWYYLPIRRLGTWYISHRQLVSRGESGGLEGEVCLESVPLKALRIRSNMTSDIWLAECNSKKERWERFRESLSPCVVLLRYKYCWRELTSGKSFMRTCKHRHQQQARIHVKSHCFFSLLFWFYPSYTHLWRTYRHIHVEMAVTSFLLNYRDQTEGTKLHWEEWEPARLIFERNATQFRL